MEEVGRNDPCPCGSGKKFKKCCMGKYPRTQSAYIGFNEPFDGITLDNGQAYIHTISGEKVKADYVFSQGHYTGETGKNKIFTLFPNKVIFDINKSFATDFDLIFAIDTNTKEIDNDLISISSIFQCNAKIIGEKIRVRWGKIINICFKNAPINAPEKIACAKLIKIIKSSRQYNNNPRIAIITDHDLSKHAKYNNGELPIHADIYLPSNITILYAKDKPNGSIMNKLIIECNNDSNKYLKQLKDNRLIVDSDIKISVNQIPDVKDNKHIIILYK